MSRPYTTVAKCDVVAKHGTSGVRRCGKHGDVVTNTVTMTNTAAANYDAVANTTRAK